jgi:hypothetical protein
MNNEPEITEPNEDDPLLSEEAAARLKKLLTMPLETDEDYASLGNVFEEDE